MPAVRAGRLFEPGDFLGVVAQEIFITQFGPDLVKPGCRNAGCRGQIATHALRKMAAGRRPEPTQRPVDGAAMARELGIDFLRAVIAGYEISTRIGAAMGRAPSATASMVPRSSSSSGLAPAERVSGACSTTSLSASMGLRPRSRRWFRNVL